MVASLQRALFEVNQRLDAAESHAAASDAVVAAFRDIVEPLQYIGHPYMGVGGGCSKWCGWCKVKRTLAALDAATTGTKPTEGGT